MIADGVIYRTGSWSVVFVAIYDGKVFVSLKTTEDDYQSITGAPRVVKGKLIIGNAGAEYGVRGYVSAYDAKTGKRDWRFYTIPGDPSKPVENPALTKPLATWHGEWWKTGGGGTVWDAFAYDPEPDLLYVGTGNGGPWSREWRSPGGSDNLYLSSILAPRDRFFYVLDRITGELLSARPITDINWATSVDMK